MLNPTLERNLKIKAQQLKPTVQMGAKGLTPAVHKEIEVALTAHELIKIKLSAAEKTERAAHIQCICDEHMAAKISAIGHTVVIYRANPK